MALTRRKVLKMAGMTAAAAGVQRAFGGTAAAAAAQKQPNILWIMADQWRMQALGFMNMDKVETPNLDKFATQGTVCMRAISTVPVCSPNRSCLFSGKYSLHNGVLCNDTTLMPEKLALGDFCKAAGYQTAYLGKWHMGFRSQPGSDHNYTPPELRHGFDHWKVEMVHQPFSQPYFEGANLNPTREGTWEPETLADSAIDYMGKRDATKPFCMVVSFGPPHTGGGEGFEGRFIPGKEGRGGKPDRYGYAAPAEYEALYAQGGKYYTRPIRGNAPPTPDWDRSKATQGYFGAITSIDKAIGRILDSVDKQGLAQDTIVVFLADHGDMMGSHGRFGKEQFYQESAGIPMIFRWPGHIPAGKYEAPVGSIDLLPTLMALSGTPCHGLDGVDLSAQLTGKSASGPEYTHGSFFMGGYGEHGNQFRAIYTPRYTYSLNHGRYTDFFGPEVMFDIEKDPLEMNPIKRGMKQDALMDDFKKRVVAHLNDLQDPFMQKMWSGGPRGNNPDPSFYQSIMDKAYTGHPGDKVDKG